MKLLRLNSAGLVLLLCLGIASGCTHKKPVLVVPQQPPTAAQPTPSPTPEPAEAQQPAEQQPQETQPAPTPEQPKPDQSKTAHKRHTAKKKPATTNTANTANNDKTGSEAKNNVTKVTVPADKGEPPPPASGQISPGPTPADVAHSQSSTEQLLQGAENNLNGITRQLSKDEEAMRAQIREFIKQSRNATTENDPTRAHTLAVKARVLSEELVKQR